jgi:hypothetical protein
MIIVRFVLYAYPRQFLSFCMNSFLVLLDRMTSAISFYMSLQLLPISIAVSYLSPVRTHTLIFAYITLSIVSETPSCNLSSIADEPKYTRSVSILSYSSLSFLSFSFSMDVLRRVKVFKKS